MEEHISPQESDEKKESDEVSIVDIKNANYSWGFRKIEGEQQDTSSKSKDVIEVTD